MARELFEHLVTVFDCAKTDACIALSFGWMQLTQVITVWPSLCSSKVIVVQNRPGSSALPAP
jgi:hypothetical protein